MKKTTLLLTLAVLVLGCDGRGRYQIVVVSASPVAYRLDTKTGEMLHIVRDKATPVRVVPREDLYK